MDIQQGQEENIPFIEDSQVTYEGTRPNLMLGYGLLLHKNELTLVIYNEGKESYRLEFRSSVPDPRGSHNATAVSVLLEGTMSSGLTLEDDIAELFAVEAKLRIIWEQGWDNMIFRLRFGDCVLLAHASCLEIRPCFDFTPFDVSDADDAD